MPPRAGDYMPLPLLASPLVGCEEAERWHLAGVRDLIVALLLVRAEDLPLPSNMAACVILAGSCPRRAFCCPTLVFGPALPRQVLSWVQRASFTFPLLAGDLLFQERGGGAVRSAPFGEGWGCRWQLPFWASLVSFAPTPALVGGSPGLGDRDRRPGVRGWATLLRCLSALARGLGPSSL